MIGLGAHLVVKRVVGAVVTVWLASTITFFAVYLVPGDIADALLGPGAAATPELRHQVVEQNGLNDPLVVQYFHKMVALATGDLGRSYQLNQPVSRLLVGQVWPTVSLAVAALFTALVLAVLAAVATAGRGRTARFVATTGELIAVSVPSFWLAIVLLAVFSFHFDLFPAVGGSGLEGLVLPTLALAIPLSGVLAQVIRQELDGAGRSPFALTTRARGLSEVQVVVRHTLRHALIPVATMSGWVLGSLLGGAVLVENLFARPGLGRILVEAVGSRDIPVVTALVLLSAIGFVVLNMIVDLIHPIIDARLQTGAPR